MASIAYYELRNIKSNRDETDRTLYEADIYFKEQKIGYWKELGYGKEPMIQLDEHHDQQLSYYAKEIHLKYPYLYPKAINEIARLREENSNFWTKEEFLLALIHLAFIENHVEGHRIESFNDKKYYVAISREHHEIEIITDEEMIGFNSEEWIVMDTFDLFKSVKIG